MNKKARIVRWFELILYKHIMHGTSELYIEQLIYFFSSSLVCFVVVVGFFYLVSAANMESKGYND